MKRKPENIQSGFISLMSKLLARVKYRELKTVLQLSRSWLAHLTFSRRSMGEIGPQYISAALLYPAHLLRTYNARCIDDCSSTQPECYWTLEGLIGRTSIFDLIGSCDQSISCNLGQDGCDDSTVDVDLLEKLWFTNVTGEWQPFKTIPKDA